MLGHKLLQLLSQDFCTWATVRESISAYSHFPALDGQRLIGGVSAQDFDAVISAINIAKPAVIINCIGVVKQVPAAQDAITSIAINSLFPHRLYQLCRAADIRLINISTDCVFTGNLGFYSEPDVTDAQDLYGRSKLLGEVDLPGCLTIRTSLIGRQLAARYGLIEWFLSQEGQSVDGYTNVRFSGLTTIALSEIIRKLIKSCPELYGLWHVSSEPISKFDLLMLVKKVYDLRIDVNRSDTPHCDRSLNSARFLKETGISIPSWTNMVQCMHDDPTPYSRAEILLC